MTVAIEVQLRTKKQHLWATAVEMVDILEDTQIKNLSHLSEENKNKKQIKWEKIFEIMSDFIAYEEGIISLSSENIVQRKCLLKQLNTAINAAQVLSSFKVLFDRNELNDREANWIVVVIDEAKQLVVVKDFIADRGQAVVSYSFYEKFYPQHNVLLASVQSLLGFQKAYPNYVGSSSEFLAIFDYWLS